MALTVSMLYVTYLSSHMHSVHSSKDCRKKKQFLRFKFPMAFSGPSSPWGPTSFLCLWNSKPILIFNIFYSKRYTRLLMFLKQINKSSNTQERQVVFAYNRSQRPQEDKNKTTCPLEPEEKHGLTPGVSGSRFGRLLRSGLGKQESSLFTHRPVLPLRTSNSLGAWNTMALFWSG